MNNNLQRDAVYEETKDVPFRVSPSTVAISYRKPAAQGHPTTAAMPWDMMKGTLCGISNQISELNLHQNMTEHVVSSGNSCNFSS